ncbi:MAG: Rpn family recombination-promoting nuclease/putative transposase [Spirochaetota bacterium]|jgi:hypothetical protein|nr:Rpn family recombination-promoting nuclease/putative transposase [Spirochaetota bacterium]
MEKINHQHKDSIFSLLFSKPDILRELYCALEGVTLPPDTPVKMNTLKNVLISDQINDISFVIGGRLVVLIEHQSTINPNMALRLLMYVSKLYEKMNKRRKLFSTALIRIPTPEFFVLYNGLASFPDQQTLKLSDSFLDTEALGLTKEQAPSLDLIVRVFNINAGRNPEIVSRCTMLNDYSTLIAKIRYYTRQLGDKMEGMKAAVQYCREHGILDPYLEEYAEEVFSMRITEWNTEEAMAVWREEGFEEGEARANQKFVRNLLAKGMPIEEIARIAELPVEQVRAIIKSETE